MCKKFNNVCNISFTTIPSLNHTFYCDICYGPSTVSQYFILVRSSLQLFKLPSYDSEVKTTLLSGSFRIFYVPFSSTNGTSLCVRLGVPTTLNKVDVREPDGPTEGVEEYQSIVHTPEST